MSKNSFVLYDEEYDYITLLSFEERGKLLTAIYEYRLQGKTDIQLSESASMLFQFIKNHIDRDTKKYLNKCEKSKQAIESRWNKNNTNEYQRIPTNTQYTDNDNDNDNVNDNELPKGNKEEITKEEKRKRFLPPSLDEVKKYCAERRNNVNAEQFIDFYTANGWKVGKNSMKDWKAAVRTWERNGIQNKGERQYSEAEKAETAAFIERQYQRFEEIGNGL